MPHISELDWSTHTHIGLDLDETLASTFEGILGFAHEQGKLLMCRSLEDLTQHDIFEMPDLDVTREDMISIWDTYSQATMDPLSIERVMGSSEGVEALVIEKKDCSVITARSDKPTWKTERTINWVSYHFPDISQDHIHFVNHYSEDARPKSHVCQNHGITLMIDDAMENAHELCLAGISCILLEKPWNRESDFEHPLLYRAKDWREIISSLEK